MSVRSFKSQLVNRGDHQVEGFDYNETFASVAKIIDVQCFRSVVVVKGWELLYMDVNNAFLYGDHEEEVYLSMLPSFTSGRPNQVYKLKKSVCGLK